jgi:hypothetical protein
MRGCIHDRFGIYNVEVLSRGEIGWIIFWERESKDNCMVSLGESVGLMDCVKGIGMMRGRDIWTLTDDT